MAVAFHVPVLWVVVAVVAAAQAAPGCKNLTTSNTLDFEATTRCAQYPNGVSPLSLEECLTLCCATDACTLFAWKDTAGGLCWPLSAATALIPNTDRSHYIGAPPPPPAVYPPSWVPLIASGDMLYAAEDTDVPAQLHPMIGLGLLLDLYLMPRQATAL